MNDIMNIGGIDCYEQDGTAYLKLETVARGLGFTRIAESGNEVVRWERVDKYLSELGVPTCGHDVSPTSGGRPDFIPENVFYRLAMKARNEAAERFQAKIADEVIPAIRKHGAYMTPETLQAALLNPDVMIQLCQQLKAEQDKRRALEVKNSALTVGLEIAKPKADYFDALVDRNLLTNFRETAKQLGMKERAFIKFLQDRRYIYRDKRGRLMPYAEKNDGIFELKETFNEKTNWTGTQTLITPKGRERFRRLCEGM